MEVEEEGQENRRRTDRFRNERFDDNSKPTAEFGKGRYFSPKEDRGNRTWRDDRGNGGRGGGNEGPRERDFNRFRGADNEMRGRRDYSSQRLFESLTDPTEVPKLGSFFEVCVQVYVCQYVCMYVCMYVCNVLHAKSTCMYVHFARHVC